MATEWFFLPKKKNKTEYWGDMVTALVFSFSISFSFFKPSKLETIVQNYKSAK